MMKLNHLNKEKLILLGAITQLYCGKKKINYLYQCTHREVHWFRLKRGFDSFIHHPLQQNVTQHSTGYQLSIQYTNYMNFWILYYYNTHHQLSIYLSHWTIESLLATVGWVWRLQVCSSLLISASGCINCDCNFYFFYESTVLSGVLF